MRATFGASPPARVTWAPHWPVSLNEAGATQTPLLSPPTERKTAAGIGALLGLAVGQQLEEFDRHTAV